MNPFFIALLAASQLFYRDIPERNDYFGQIICGKSRCYEFYPHNGLEVYFTGIKYYYKNKRSTVKLFCRLWNKSNDTFLLNRRFFSISSDANEYILQPGVLWERGLPKKYPDTLLRIAPESYGNYQLYNFEYTSKNRMPRKLMGSDTLRFQYSGSGQAITVFGLVAVLKVDPTWTREETIRAFTY